jgi:hypothetical protein
MSIDFIVNDETGCVHCPKDHNYLSWSIVLSDADGHFVANFGRSGWKLFSQTIRRLSRTVFDPSGRKANFRRQPNNALEPTSTRNTRFWYRVQVARAR